MTAYTTSKARGGPSPGVGGASQEVSVYTEYSVTAALATNDYIEMVTLPANAVVTGMTLHATDLDTDGSPALTLSVGDSASANRFISASTIGQAGGYTSTLASGTGAMFYKYTAPTKIRVTAAAGAATGTTGTIKLLVSYIVSDQVMSS